MAYIDRIDFWIVETPIQDSAKCNNRYAVLCEFLNDH